MDFSPTELFIYVNVHGMFSNICDGMHLLKHEHPQNTFKTYITF